MSNDSLYALVPASRRDAVAAAIRETFGSGESVVLTPLHGGYSGAPVIKLTVAGKPHVLRVIHAPSPLNDPKRHFACMTAAADQGLAPPMLFADESTPNPSAPCSTRTTASSGSARCCAASMPAPRSPSSWMGSR
ncbi:hypothetical protein [Cystobacter fuscus]|uniref:hypothetical protein n=1 Tax=Cystobacter fuscus TaxID=43 RepID=UPI0012DDC79F|nr:hypothetical protein [Cystobacter fuscus]